MFNHAQRCTVLLMPVTRPKRRQVPLSAGIQVDGNAVRLARQALGETITTLAPKAGMSIGYLSQVERGRRPSMSPPAFLRLVNALGKKPDELRRAA